MELKHKVGLSHHKTHRMIQEIASKLGNKLGSNIMNRESIRSNTQVQKYSIA